MNLRRILAGTLAFACVSSVNVFAADTTAKSAFSDVKADTEVGTAIEKMYEAGYIKGYTDGTFKPEGYITRAELTRVFNQVFGYKADEEKLKTMANFTDNTESDAWYYNDVRIAQSNGYINGFEDKTFRPKDNFTRQQTCVVLAQAAKLPETDKKIEITDEVSEWAKSYVVKAVAAGAFELESKDTFRATDNITRGEVCVALAKYIGSADKTETTTVKSEVTTKSDSTKESSTETTTTATTETTTKKSTSSGGGGGSSSGGSSGGSSSNTSTTTTTVATTEATTEATTSKVETTTEATTTEPVTLSSEEMNALKGIIRDTKSYLIPDCSTSAQKELAQYILNAMQSYYNDPTYDVLSDISTAKSMYYGLSAGERSEFQSLCLSSLSLSDIQTLKPIFEPFL